MTHLSTATFLVVSFVFLFVVSCANAEGDCNPDCINGGYCNDQNQCECVLGYTNYWCNSISCAEEIGAGHPEINPKRGDIARCQCSDGWAGENCRVCENDNACVSAYGAGSQCIHEKFSANATVYQSCSVDPPYGLLLGENITTYCNADTKRCQLEAFHTYDDSETEEHFLTEVFFCLLDDCAYTLNSDGSYDYTCPDTKCGCRYCATEMIKIVEGMKGRTVLRCDSSNHCKIEQEHLFFSMGMKCGKNGGCTKPKSLRTL